MIEPKLQNGSVSNPNKKFWARSMVIYFSVCVLAMIWPGAIIANRIEPIVIGLPFFFFWYVLWVFMLFVGLIVSYRLEQSGKEQDDE